MEDMKKKHIFTFHDETSLTTPLTHFLNKLRTVGNSRIWPMTAELLQIRNTDRIPLAKYYSNYWMLIKRTAWVYFAIRKWHDCSDCATSDTLLILPSQIDRPKAENYWIRIVQADSFKMEIRCLQENNNLPLNSNLIWFSPFLADKKLMRVHGRLAFSDLTQ